MMPPPKGKIRVVEVTSLNGDGTCKIRVPGALDVHDRVPVVEGVEVYSKDRALAYFEDDQLPVIIQGSHVVKEFPFNSHPSTRFAQWPTIGFDGFRRRATPNSAIPSELTLNQVAVFPADPGDWPLVTPVATAMPNGMRQAMWMADNLLLVGRPGDSSTAYPKAKSGGSSGAGTANVYAMGIDLRYRNIDYLSNFGLWGRRYGMIGPLNGQFIVNGGFGSYNGVWFVNIRGLNPGWFISALTTPTDDDLKKFRFIKKLPLGNYYGAWVLDEKIFIPKKPFGTFTPGAFFNPVTTGDSPNATKIKGLMWGASASVVVGSMTTDTKIVCLDSSGEDDDGNVLWKVTLTGQGWFMNLGVDPVWMNYTNPYPVDQGQNYRWDADANQILYVPTFIEWHGTTLDTETGMGWGEVQQAGILTRLIKSSGGAEPSPILLLIILDAYVGGSHYVRQYTNPYLSILPEVGAYNNFGPPQGQLNNLTYFLLRNNFRSAYLRTTGELAGYMVGRDWFWVNTGDPSIGLTPVALASFCSDIDDEDDPAVPPRKVPQGYFVGYTRSGVRQVEWLPETYKQVHPQTIVVGGTSPVKERQLPEHHPFLANLMSCASNETWFLAISHYLETEWEESADSAIIYGPGSLSAVDFDPVGSGYNYDSLYDSTPSAFHNPGGYPSISVYNNYPDASGVLLRTLPVVGPGGIFPYVQRRRFHHTTWLRGYSTVGGAQLWEKKIEYVTDWLKVSISRPVYTGGGAGVVVTDTWAPNPLQTMHFYYPSRITFGQGNALALLIRRTDEYDHFQDGTALEDTVKWAISGSPPTNQPLTTWTSLVARFGPSGMLDLDWVDIQKKVMPYGDFIIFGGSAYFIAGTTVYDPEISNAPHPGDFNLWRMGPPDVTIPELPAMGRFSSGRKA